LAGVYLGINDKLGRPWCTCSLVQRYATLAG
jgi:hypothetical protein